MTARQDAAVPVLAILVLVGIALLLVGLVVIAITLQAILALFLVAMGGYLFFRPERLSGYGPTARMVIPILLILLAILVYSGWLEV